MYTEQDFCMIFPSRLFPLSSFSHQPPLIFTPLAYSSLCFLCCICHFFFALSSIKFHFSTVFISFFFFLLDSLLLLFYLFFLNLSLSSLCLFSCPPQPALSFFLSHVFSPTLSLCLVFLSSSLVGFITCSCM